ncbi:MAG: hypothetical protein H7832_06025 [Magnetococcus sp. DMHC-6]
MKKLLFLLFITPLLTSCFFTKIATVPMRVTGAVISVVPGVGNGVDAVIDTAADGIDNVPL